MIDYNIYLIINVQYVILSAYFWIVTECKNAIMDVAEKKQLAIFSFYPILSTWNVSYHNLSITIADAAEL